jgi:Phage integrase, N-terminal SAM-like domain
MGRLEENTVVDYGGSWRRRLEPRFGSWRLDEITPREISKWRTDMQKAGVGPEAIRKAMVLLQAMFTLAVEWGESNTSPVSLVRRPA